MLEAQLTCSAAAPDPLSSTAMLPSIAASAAAARALRYPGLGDLIEAEQLPPQRIARLFCVSASKSAARDCAIVLLAAGLGRYRACPHGWTGDVERTLALDALAAEPDPAAALATLAEVASRIVSQHWGEMPRNDPAPLREQ
jgi:hypothetical protein